MSYTSKVLIKFHGLKKHVAKMYYDNIGRKNAENQGHVSDNHDQKSVIGNLNLTVLCLDINNTFYTKLFNQSWYNVI